MKKIEKIKKNDTFCFYSGVRQRINKAREERRFLYFNNLSKEFLEQMIQGTWIGTWPIGRYFFQTPTLTYGNIAAP